MSSPEIVLQVLRTRLRAARITYRDLAERIGMSESSIKRVFGQKDMSLSRLARICQAADLAMDEVLREAADRAPRVDTLTLAQERALVADPRLLLMAICCLGQWTLEQIVETYELTLADCVRLLVKLDRLGLILLRPDNTYRLKVSLTFHWRAHGPAQQYLRSHVVPDYFGGSFDGEGELVMCLPARLSITSAQEMTQRVRQLGAELARLQSQDARLAPAQRDGYTLMVGLRSWEFSAFTRLRRNAHGPGQGQRHQIGPRKM